MQDRRGGSGVDGPQGTGEELGVLDGLQPVGFRADPQHDVLLGDGAAVAVVRLALRVAAAGRTHVQPLAAGPGDGQGQFAHGIGGLVVLRLGVHVAEDHRADLRHGNGLGGDLGHDLFAGLIQLLVVHVGDDQHVGGQHQHRDVAADLGPVKVGFQVHQVRHAVAAVQGVVDDVGHQPGVEAGLLEGTFKALALRRCGCVSCGVGWPGCHCRAFEASTWEAGSSFPHFHRSAGHLLTAAQPQHGPPGAVRPLGGVPDPDVGGQDGSSLRAAEHGVELHQRDLGMVVLQPGQPAGQVLQGRHVHGRQALVAEQLPGRPRRPDEVR